MRKPLLFILFSFALIACGQGDPLPKAYVPPASARVTGSVRDALTGQALEAKVTIGEQRLVSNAGSFSAEGVPVGIRLLRAEVDTYRVFEKEINVPFTGVDVDLLLFPVTTATGGSNDHDDENKTAPTLAMVTPLNAAVGSVITLTGSDLGAVQAGSQVLFSGIAGQVLTWSDTTVHAVVPTILTPGSILVTVVVGGKASGAMALTVSAIAVSTPVAPLNVTAEANGSYRVAIIWTDSSNNEDRFEVERKQGAGGFSKIAQLGANFAQFTDLAVEPQVSYTYRVKAVNSAGASTSGEAVAATPADISGGSLPTPPPAPSSVNASVISAFKVTLAWTSNSSGQESGFWIQRSVDGGGFVWIATVASGVTAFDDESVTPDHSYEYRVRAYNSGGNSVYVASNSVTTPDVAPSVPGNLIATAFSAHEVFLTWSDYAGNETGTTIERKLGGFAFAPVGFAAAGEVSFSDSTVMPGASYTYRIRALNAVGASPYSQQAAVFTPDVVPASPGNLNAVAQTASILLSWTDQSSNETGFRVYRSAIGAPISLLATLAAGVTSYNDTAVASGQAYEYQVAAINLVGESTKAIESAIAPWLPPDTPGNLAVSALSQSQALLTWTNGANPGSELRVFRALGLAAFTQVGTLSASNLMYLDSGLSSATTYRWKIVAANADFTAESAIIATTMPAESSGGSGGTGTPPAAPTGLSGVVTISSGGEQSCPWDSFGTETIYFDASQFVQLRWTDQSPDELGFIIEQNDGASWRTISVVGPNLSATTVPAPDGTAMNYRVRSYGTGGQSPASNQVGVETPLRSLNGICIVPRGSDGVHLSWVSQGTAESMRIERIAEGESLWQLLGDVDADFEFYHDASAGNRMRYFYRLTPFKDTVFARPVSAIAENYYWRPIWTERISQNSGKTALWSGAGETIAVGQGGKIFREQANVWEPMRSPTSRNLYSVWGSAADNIWAGGSRGTLLHYNGAAWGVWPAPARGNLTAMHGVGASEIWAVGAMARKNGIDKATVIRWNGIAWADIAVPIPAMLETVWVNSASDVWVGGRYGVIMHWNGTVWSAVPLPSQQHVKALAGTSASNMFAGMIDGGVYHFDGAGWQELRAADGKPVTALWNAPAQSLYATVFEEDPYGADGARLLRYDGGWQTVLAPSFSDGVYLAIAGSSPSSLRVASNIASRNVTTAARLPFERTYKDMYGTQGGRIVVRSEESITDFKAGVQREVVPPATILGMAADDAAIYARAPILDGMPWYYAYAEGIWQPGPVMTTTTTLTDEIPTTYVGDYFYARTKFETKFSAYASLRITAKDGFILLPVYGKLKYDYYYWNGSKYYFNGSGSGEGEFEFIFSATHGFVDLIQISWPAVYDNILYSFVCCDEEIARYTLSTTAVTALPPTLTDFDTNWRLQFDGAGGMYGVSDYFIPAAYKFEGSWTPIIEMQARFTPNLTGAGYAYHALAYTCCGPHNLTVVGESTTRVYPMPTFPDDQIWLENETTPWFVDDELPYRLE